MTLGDWSLSALTSQWMVECRSRLVGRGLVYQARSHRPEVALTFDDGPHPEFTPRVLDALDRAQLRATFFVVGQAMRRHPDLVRETRQRGHEIGSHLESHDRGVVFDDQRFEAELAECRQQFESVLGEPLRWLRFPYGERGRQRPLALKERQGITAVHWTYSSHDSRARHPDEVVARVRAGLRPGVIVLLHDALADAELVRAPYVADRAATIDALPGIGDLLSARGFRAVTLSRLLA